MKDNYSRTIRSCFVGNVVMAIINNFAPLLFLTFQSSFDISLAKITLLVTINFGLQLLVDFVSVTFVDKIGYRAAMVTAHIMSALGLVAMTILPGLFADPFIGLLLSVAVYACGGGMLEVIVSPMVEACPTENKEKTMSLLHSFYSWGQVATVLISTAFFALFGIENWRILAIFWAVVPLVNALIFTKVPIAPLHKDGEKALPIKALAGKRIFWLLLLLMLCAGASEQAVSQWASAFAESGLGVSKALGDLAGPMMFAVMMGLSRLFYGKLGHRIKLRNFMLMGGVLCLISYLLISLSPLPGLSLIGCGLCGLSVGILWPGTLSIASGSIRGGGTAMFAFLALAGDLGCAAGPTFVGLISGAFDDNLKTGILAAIIFPAIMLLGLLFFKKKKAF